MFLLNSLFVSGFATSPVLQDSTHISDSTSNLTISQVLIEKGADLQERAEEKFIMIFEKSPVFIVILYIVIIYSILALIILTITILFKRSVLKKKTEIKEELDEKYQILLMDYLFNIENGDSVFKEINRIASDKFKRQILINQLIELSVNVQGEMKENIKALYLNMGLKKDSLKKAYSKKWHENVKGFRELAFMNIREANDKIYSCLNSHNDILRMEAQISLVRLSDDNPYSFLDHLEKPLALWEQITLHELVIQHKLNTPDFSQWFKSENLSIVIFSLQMVSWFKQKEALEGIVSLAHHEDDNVRNQAIRVCGELELDESLETLKEIFSGENYKNKLDILVAFSKVPNDEYLEFLNEALDKEEDVQLQISATKAMENLGEAGISRLIKLMKSKTEFKNYQIIIRHVLDGRIY